MRRLRNSLLVLLGCVMSTQLWAACDPKPGSNVCSDVRNTRHNFSATLVPNLGSGNTRRAKAETVTRVCVFCHTPHHGTDLPNAPLWNRKLAGVTYTPTTPYKPYDSGSLDASPKPGDPTGRSKLCLSCHDGTLALGSVNVFNGQKNPPQINMVGSGVTNTDQTIPSGLGADTGFTRRLGTDLTNDHPISFTFDSAQAARDGELVDPATSNFVGLRDHSRGLRPELPLDDNQVECISCHDPHVRDKDDPSKNIKFLRVNRFQQSAPFDGSFSPSRDIICLACHDKDGWVGSAHANPTVGNETYQPGAAELREFPANTQVWQAACLNCHDTHTVQGSRRLLREGTDGPVQVTAKGAKYKQGGKPAIEEVCYACHSDDGAVLVGQGSAGYEPPDIKTDFTQLPRHMPITTRDQPGSTEVHNIGTHPTVPQSGKDFVEDEALLAQRHAECTDCHNPHRVMKNRLFNANNSTPDVEGTHPHHPADITNSGQSMHSNLASGVLRGISGVEPIYGSTAFGDLPVGYEIKYGDPLSSGNTGSTAVSSPYVTREYQVCMKCHSDNAYATPPALGSFGGGTPPGTNSMTNYTNQAMEYNSPVSHQGEGTATGTGAFSGNTDNAGNTVDYVTNNHRSWHPVIRNTGRTLTVRGINPTQNPWLSPWNMAQDSVGNQTMYCTDCHGSNTPQGTADPNDEPTNPQGTGPNHVDGNPWGPHGSSNDFLLKGSWDKSTGTGQTTGLCFKCHDYNSYGNTNLAAANSSGFSGTMTQTACLGFNSARNLHIGHANVLAGNTGIPGNNGGIRCTFCHVAVPHGWKNKVFLANLNDVGLEAPVKPGELSIAGNAGTITQTASQRQVRNGQSAAFPALPAQAPRYFNGPYYNGATLKVKTFSTSGNWVQTSCGSAGPPGNGQTGQAWMSNSSEACRTLP
ncbi:MAG: hypothetical protein D6698_08450 [Gammaproteobacteria bacterium]|nr:MAG: hypothetical protein D6698_08450 [Gammaproteobacteria bacterium]